jgi:guanyl-specific ribonuclease Sa
MPTGRNPRFRWAWWLLALVLLLAWQYRPLRTGEHPAPPAADSPGSRSAPPPASTSRPGQASAESPPDARLPAFLPAEAGDTIALIRSGGPFPHPQDGGVFGNREGHLPRKPRGWYREYTVETPGLSHRGTRRIITGGNPPSAWYYTGDHYDSFRAFNPGSAGGATP